MLGKEGGKLTPAVSSRRHQAMSAPVAEPGVSDVFEHLAPAICVRTGRKLTDPRPTVLPFSCSSHTTAIIPVTVAHDFLPIVLGIPSSCRCSAAGGLDEAKMIEIG